MVLDYLSNTLQLRCKANAESSLLVMLSCSPQCIIFDDTKIQKFPEICKYLDHYFCPKKVHRRVGSPVHFNPALFSNKGGLLEDKGGLLECVTLKPVDVWEEGVR